MVLRDIEATTTVSLHSRISRLPTPKNVESTRTKPYDRLNTTAAHATFAGYPAWPQNAKDLEEHDTEMDINVKKHKK